MWDWLTDTWEYITPGQDDKGIFANVGDWWSGDEETSTDSAFSDDLFKELGIDPVTGEYSDGTVTTINPIEYSEGDPFQWLYESDPDFAYDILKDQQDENTALWDEKWDWDEWEKENEPNWLDTILGFVGGKEGKNKAQGIMRNVVGGIGDLGNSPLGQLALLNYLKNQREQDIKIPIGQEAYGGGQGLGSMPDYRIFNLQPALMPGVGYANAPPPGMKDGGLTGLSQKIGEGVDNYAISPYLAEVGFFEDPSFAKYVEGARLYNQNTKAPGIFKSVAPFMDDSFEALQDGYEAFLKSFKEKRGLGSLQGETETMQEITMQEMKHGGLKDGPGDITLARLEPGEFVMTRKATDNIGAKNLYSLMKQAERMG